MLRPIRWLYNNIFSFSWMPRWGDPKQSHREWKQDWSDLDEQHKESTVELQILAEELGMATPEAKPQIRRQRVYKIGPSCPECGTVSYGLCTKCTAKETSNVQYRS